MAITDVVNVVITRQTQAVSQKGFGVMLFLGLNKVFNERLRFYASVKELLNDGFLVTAPEVAAATAAFAQHPSPEKIAIGRQQADRAVIDVAVVQDATSYQVTINSINFIFTSGTGTTNLLIAAGLVAAINAGSQTVIATDNNDGSFHIDPTVSQTSYSLFVDAKLSVTLTPSESLTAALNAIRNENDDWYGLAAYTHVTTDILEIAAYVEATNNEGAKLYGVSSQDPAVLMTATTDIASLLQAANYARTWLLYNGNADELFPECSWFGKMLPTDPGSQTWKFKTLNGQIADRLTSTQKTNALNKNANIYIEIGGIDVTENGTVADDEFIDVIVGVDWLTSRLEERIFALLAKSGKVPYTDAGVALIENEIQAQLKAGVTANFLAADPAPQVNVPQVKDINPVDKSHRYLPGINFTTVLAGAIHSISIQGYVTV